MNIDPTLRALNRFGLGARPGEREGLDPQRWLARQITPAAATLTGPRLLSSQAILDNLAALRAQGQSQESRKAVRQAGREIYQQEMIAGLNHAITTQAPFAERLVRFWSNHFAISVQGEQMVTFFAGAYEREVIRAHVFGRFEDMVLASAQHPAMLIYLDQTRSIGPNSRAGRNNGRGLNENYARELLELHTLGVKGGYDQDDVRELALILTGWTVGGLNRGARSSKPLPYAFAERQHEPGGRRLLGQTIPAGGEDQGRRAISMLCRHPSTARFVATKLVRHFVDDEPHPLDVDAIAAVFQQTGGNLAAVSLALLSLDDAFYGPGRKFRLPQDFMIAAARALGLRKLDRAAVRAARDMRHIPWSPSSPAGFSDRMVDWADPDSLLRRADLAKAIAKQTKASAPAVQTLPRDTIQPSNPEALTQLLRRQPDAESQLAILLASPDFQWR